MPDRSDGSGPEGAGAALMRGVGFAWPGRARFGIAVERFAVARGERVLLLGPSGSGKSTLLALLCGIAAPQRGRIRVLDRDLTAMSGPRRDRFRGEHFGIVFQMFNLLPWASALDNVLTALTFAPRRRARAAAAGGARAEAERLLRALGVAVEGPAAALSVGQQQRVAAARALIGAPELIVADEPTSALDAAAQKGFLDLLFEQAAEAGATLLTVSHDERLAPLFDRAVALADIAAVARGGNAAPPCSA